MNRKKVLILLFALLASCGVWAEPTWTVTTKIGEKDTFVVTRSESTYAQTVLYRTVNLSAYAGQHYTAASGSLTFDVGETVKKVTVTRTIPGTDAYKYQNGNTTRSYRFEVTDQGGFYLAHNDYTFTTGTSFNAAKVSQSITNLVYFNSSGNYTSALNSNKYLDVSYTPPTSQVETSGTLSGYVLIDDSYDYAQKAATVSTSTLISSTHATAAYLNELSYKIVATVCFTEKERDDGYQYIQIVAGNGSASYDTGYDPEKAVNDPVNSVYKVCFELSNNSNAEGKQLFPHRYNYANKTEETSASIGITEFSQTNGKLWQQKFKSGYQATNSGSLIFDANVANITTRFDAGGNNDDTWGYKDLFVRMALVDATAPTVLAYSVAPGRHSKGDTVYVSVSFNEIVTSSSAKLTSNWGDLSYVAGSGSNVLTFSREIPASASSSLNITGFSGITDLAGNAPSSITANNLCPLDASYNYSITYDLAGDNVATSNPATYTWETATFTLANPTRDGYTFDGWPGSNGNTPQTTVTIANHSHGNKSYTANWTPITYNLTYDLAGGSVATSNPATYTIETADFILVNPTRDNYVFLGWTGTDLSEPTMTVTIAQGSTGDRSYTATWLLTLPYSYGFEEAVGWTQWSSLTGNNERILGRVSHSGSYSLRFKGSTSNVVVLPPFNAATSSLQLSFWTRPESYVSPRCGTFSVGYLTDPADAATFVAVRTYSYSDWASNDYRRKTVNFEGAPDNARLAFRHNPTNSGYYWYVDDVEVMAPGCFVPEELEVTYISDSAATFSWPATASTQWEYALVANAADDYTPVEADFSGTYTATQSGTQSITFSTLTELTPYTFFLRRSCGAQSKSAAESLRFRTLMTLTAPPYVEDFESSNGWALENGTLTNQWVWGTAAHNGEGTRALYISNDGGTTNAYSNDITTVFAWKRFSFEEGRYTFSYDWRAMGEGAYDYLRVALVPDGTELTASYDVPYVFGYDYLPTGWIALDGGSQLNDTYEWQRFTTDSIAVAAGNYKMVFVWRNNYYESYLPPAAVDNVRIAKCKRFVTDGNWNDATKWSPAGVPDADDGVIIEAAAVIPDGYVACCVKAVIDGGSVTIADGGQLVCNSDIPVTVQKNVAAGQWNGISGMFLVDDLSSLTTGTAYDLFSYDEEHATWLNQKADDGAAGFNRLDGMYGYIYRRDANAIIDLATENYNRSWGAIYFASCSDDALRGFNLAGNPCTHDIYFGTGITVRDGSIAPGFYTLDADGTWRAHTTADPIHVAEAFLIQVTTGDATLYFYNTNAAPAPSKAAPQAATLAFSVKGNGHEDVAYAVMSEELRVNSEGLRKMGHLNEEAPMLSIDGYAIATLSDTTEAFSLTLQAQPGEYTLGTRTSSSATIGYCHLIDRVAGRDIDLLRDSTYTFTVAAGSAGGNRFLVKLTPRADETSALPGDFASWDGDRLVVTGEGTLEAYDVMGRRLFTQTIKQSGNQTIPTSQFPGMGVYLLRLNGQTQKIIIK